MPTPGEFEIIRRYFTRPERDSRVLAGIGDDAAIVDVTGPVAIAVDMLVAGTHFPADLPARAVGHRSLAVNLSDLAAVGAVPRWATLALSLPAVDEHWLDAFAAGFFALADRYGVSLIGGDTTRGPLTVTVQLTGESSPAPLLRSGGRPGDHILVSGTLGDSAAALDWLPVPAADRSPEAAEIVDRFCYPEPRVALGRVLGGTASAAIDISDGLLADLGHVCRASGCGALIDLNALPLSAALRRLHPRDRAEELALHGGDDYELCFTCGDDALVPIRAGALEAGIAVTEIGALTDGSGIRGRRDGRTIALAASGFVHF